MFVFGLSELPRALMTTINDLNALAESMPSKKRMSYADMVAPVATLKAKAA